MKKPSAPAAVTSAAAPVPAKAAAGPTPTPAPAQPPAARAKAKHNTVSFREDPEIIERLESLRPHARRADGQPAYQSDVSRAILGAVLGDPAILGRIMASPGATLSDKLRGVLKKLA